MKKRIISLVALLALAFAVSMPTASARATTFKPSLTFNGTTDVCSVICKAPNSNDQVKATLAHYQGTTLFDSWSVSGKGWVAISEQCKGQSEKTYKLTLTYSINGVSKPSVSVTATCP